VEPQKEEKKEGRFQIDRLEERITPSIVAVNGGGNTPNGRPTACPAITQLPGGNDYPLS
jgi:hypothetical protein